MLGRDELAIWDQQGDAYAKLGTFGRSVAAVYPEVTFLQETDFNPVGAYPEFSSAQVYRPRITSNSRCSALWSNWAPTR